jgi:hypothetical protein
MQRYSVRRDTLGCTYAGYPSDTVEVYLASDADSERIAYGHEYYVEGRRVGRARERRDIIQSIERETACRTWQDALDLIRARGESKPEPRLGTNTPTATAKIMEIKYCPECGTALGIVEANPSKIERIAVRRRTDWEIPTVELADKLNELIDAWNGGKA